MPQQRQSCSEMRESIGKACGIQQDLVRKKERTVLPVFIEVHCRVVFEDHCNVVWRACIIVRQSRHDPDRDCQLLRSVQTRLVGRTA